MIANMWLPFPLQKENKDKYMKDFIELYWFSQVGVSLSNNRKIDYWLTNFYFNRSE